MSLGDFNFEIFLCLVGIGMSIVEYCIAFLKFNPINILLSPIHIRLVSDQLIAVYISIEKLIQLKFSDIAIALRQDLGS